ncbi:MAG: bifunctional riboflavin kinase/FAD synthetase [Desulfobacterales bacterium]|nr:bifunctional riboflavin kinase/FAD synthetase [Desulfobacterales bacterium]
MKLIEKLNDIKEPFKNAVITIGNFDGVHIGHQSLLHEVVEKAAEINGTAIAITFEPHPMRVLKKKNHPPLITLYEQKIELIEKSKINVLICIPFNKTFAALSAREFIEDILVKKIGMKAIIIGKDYTFGKNREGDIALLKRFAVEMGFKVILNDWIIAPHNKFSRISSTAIRNLVIEGKVDDAQKMLGRYYQVRGKVIQGRDRGGKLLGFPTANITLNDELVPKAGVYAVTVECLKSQYQGVANIGYSPTFDDHLFSVEVHLLYFKKDIYGENIRVNFIQRIRDELKFSNINELSEQIKKDIDLAKEILSG